MHKILLVDDDPDILELLKYNLQKEGYQIFTAKDGMEAIKLASKYTPHLILMDVMMPKMDGMEACEELRSLEDFQDTIIVLLTARGEDFSQIAGFNAGADDYIIKPIKPRVLVSKIASLLRRTVSKQSEINTIFKGVRIDSDKHQVIKDGEEIKFARKEFELLKLMFSDIGKVFTRDEIMRTVWGAEVFVGDRTIDVHIRKLREKLGEDIIETIKGVGYRVK